MDLRKYHNELFEYLRVKSSQKRCSADMHFLLEALQEKALQECHDRVFEAVDIANNDWGFSKSPDWVRVLRNWRGYNFDYPLDVGIVEFEFDGVVYCHLRFYEGILGERAIFKCDAFELLDVINEFVYHDDEDDEEEIA